MNYAFRVVRTSKLITPVLANSRRIARPSYKNFSTESIKWKVENDNNIAYLSLVDAVKKGDKEFILSKIDEVGDKRDSKDNSLLHHAAAAGKTETIELLIQKGFSINSKNSNGATPLHAALMSCQLDSFAVLIQHGASIHVKDDYGLSPLHLAVISIPDSQEIIETLVKLGANLEETTNSGATPLAYSLKKPKIAKKLIECGADVNAKMNNESILHTAAAEGSIEVVEMLLLAGAEIDRKTKNGKTALRFATEYGQLEQIYLLVKLGADINTQDEFGTTPLMVAAARDDVLTLKLLIHLGADLEKTTQEGTALFFATNASSVQCVKKLAEAGANQEKETAGYTPLLLSILKGDNEIAQFLYCKRIGKEQKEDDEDINIMEYLLESNIKSINGHSPFFRACGFNNVELMKYLKSKMEINVNEIEDGITPVILAAVGNATEAIEELVNMGADLSISDSSGYTPIHHAATHQHEKAIHTLLRLGANVDSVDKSGFSALHHSSSSSNLSSIQILTKLGADVNKRASNGETPLFLVTKEDVFETLLNTGADISITSEDKRSLLHVYSSAGNLPLVKRLIELGMDTNLQDNMGFTPLHYAKQHSDVFLQLLKAGASTTIEDTMGNTIVHSLAEEGRAETLRVMLEYDAKRGQILADKNRIDVNRRGYEGMTPFLYAAYSGSIATLKVLIEAGADAHATSLDGNNALHIAASRGTIQHHHHEHDCDHEHHEHTHECETHAHNCETHAHNCATHAHETHAHGCESHGCKTHAHDCATHASSCATHTHAYETQEVEFNAEEMPRELVKLGLDVNAVNHEGLTPLFYSNEFTLPVFLALGADTNKGETKEGEKLLHVVVKDEDVEIIQSIIKAGASKTEKDREGRTPYDLAMQLGLNHIAEILRF